MAKQAYVSISDLAWKAMGHPDFDKFKIGNVDDTSIPGRKYEIVGGIPATAKLKTVIYLYEDESLEDVANPFSLPSVVILSQYTDSGVPAVFKFDGTELLKIIPRATEFYEVYQYEPLNVEIDPNKKEITLLEGPAVRSMRFKLSEKDSEGRYVYLPAN